jgi:predicted AlkP superfamily pyrophosphatase or phosphodiesterase
LRIKLFLALLLSTCVVAGLACPDTDASQQPQPPEPKLVVLVVFDQMRGDYPARWEKLYDKDGFGRLLHEGAWFQNCHYPYAYTLTAAGHASMATGCPPAKHGIIANDWHDRASGTKTAAVASRNYRQVSLLNRPLGEPGYYSPEHRHQPAVGDLRRTAKMRPKIVSLSIKERSAILLAAMRAAACYWFDTKLGLFVTSTFYRDTPHPWVEAFNRQRPADAYFGKDWNRLRPDLDYVALSGKDDVVWEGTGYGQGRTFPHPTTGGLDKPGKKFYDAVTNSPYGNEMLLDLARRAIDGEKLGQGDSCDLLCLSFSSNDLIGHCWGPDSQEVLDITLRSDLIIKELLQYLDAKVGKDRYVVVVSADHGVGPIPELAKSQGKAADRISPALFTGAADKFLRDTFAAGRRHRRVRWVDAFEAGYIYLNQANLQELKLAAADVEKALAGWLSKQPGILAAYPRSRLLQGPFPGDPIGESVRLSFYPEYSGDVAVVEQPYHIITGPLTDAKQDSYRTTHGSPHPYDTHVPLLVYGACIQPGVHAERVTPLAIAAIVARALGVPTPAGAEYPVPKGLFR